MNAGRVPLNLAGIRLTGGVEFVFPENPDPEKDLDPGAVVLVVRDLAAFASRYRSGDLNIADEYRGKLSNGGESIALRDRLGRSILDFSYEDDWYPATDGDGYSLEIDDPRAEPEAWNRSAGWTLSADLLGSPGRHDGVPPPGGRQYVGDANQDGHVDIADVVGLLRLLFVGGRTAPPCETALAGAGNRRLLDVNADAGVNLTDGVYLLEYLFGGGPPPALGADCMPIEGCPDVCLR